ncbi:putative sodium-coupled neutral amino acid transporter 10 isoform X2 [Uloborus diversus]|nr:putative sodium-coupled neutral amino acid transporter 10 isoform X2 [Uloborus diversus]
MLMLIGLCVALPLGMLRKIDSLTSLSALSIAFYACLITKIFDEALPNLAKNEWWYEVNWWQTDGILPCLPIFSMALSCQTQLFEFFDTLNDPSLKRMQSVVAGAVTLCSLVYILVGTLGYIAFHNEPITGNALILLTPSMVTEVIKLGFILTVAVSFPLCLFPCRSSLHSLLFKQGFGHHEITVNIIPDHRFRILTVSLVIITIGVAIMLPNIEFVLGIIGSTIGTLICLIFPAAMFIHDTSKNTAEKRLSQLLMSIGTFILIACTYSTLNEPSSPPEPVTHMPPFLKVTPEVFVLKTSALPEIKPSEVIISKTGLDSLNKEKKDQLKSGIPNDQKRQEPPIPQEPEIKPESVQNGDLDPQALQKEDKEIQKDMDGISANTATKSNKELDKQEQILQKLEEQQEEQKLILKQQKDVLEELKRHKESHEEELRKIEAVAERNAIPIVETENLPRKTQTKDKILQEPDTVQKENIVPVQISSHQKQHTKHLINNKTTAEFHAEVDEQKVNTNYVNKKIEANNEEGKLPKDDVVLKEHRVNKTETGKTRDILVNTSVDLKEDVKDNHKLSIAKKVEKHKSEKVIADNFVNQDAHLKQRETLGEKAEIKETVVLPKTDIKVQEVLISDGNAIS